MKTQIVSAVIFIASFLCVLFSGCSSTDKIESKEESSFFEYETDETEIKKTVTFPDWLGEVDNSLAMNSLYNFKSWKGQGTVRLNISDKVKSFKLFVNNHSIPSDKLRGYCTVDVSQYTENGESTLQICEIKPESAKDAIQVQFDYPVVVDSKSSLKDSGINPLAFDYIEKIIKADIKNGFSSAQLAVVKDGKLIYSNGWGKLNSYNQDGSPKEDGGSVTTETLYDLASVTKVVAGNFAVQYLVSRNLLSLDDRVCDILGSAFYKKTAAMKYTDGVRASLKQHRQWKSEITVRDLLFHQAGFPAGPRYQEEKNKAKRSDDQERKWTYDSICHMALMYEPRTASIYSDVDYMVLTFVIEKITGQRLDEFLREKIYGPMDLKHTTYKPALNGFMASDCAATELTAKNRLYTIQGEVHDENAYSHMAGVSGHAGLFSNAEELAKLGEVMLTGGWGTHCFFSPNVIDFFTAPGSAKVSGWGAGWYRAGEYSRPWYFGVQAPSRSFGHQGWTGTFIMIDPVNNLVIAYLTNKVNTPGCVHNGRVPYFEGSFYTSAQIGFVPAFIYQGMKISTDREFKAASDALVRQMLADKNKLIKLEEKKTRLKNTSGIYKSAKALKEVSAD